MLADHDVRFTIIHLATVRNENRCIVSCARAMCLSSKVTKLLVLVLDSLLLGPLLCWYSALCLAVRSGAWTVALGLGLDASGLLAAPVAGNSCARIRRQIAP